MSHPPSLKHSLRSTTLAALLTTTAMAFAQTPPTQPGPPKHPHMQERMQKHLTDLKTQLKLEPGQEPAWTAWTTAMQAPAHKPAERDQHRAAMEKLTTPERIDHMKVMRAQRDAEMDERAQATKGFYAQLNAEQKKTFDARAPRFGREHDRPQGGPGHHR